MKTTASKAVTLAVAVLGVGQAAQAAGVGEPAPELRLGQYIEGAPVDLKAAVGRNITVIEFWATWCGPCRISIPHLTEVQKKYKDKGVVIVAISDEEPQRVRSFVEEQGEAMAYTVAVDTPQRDSSRAYMQAFYINTTPHAFIVDRSGVVAWHGSPLDASFDKAIEDMLAGTYDLQAFKKADAPRLAMMEKRELPRLYFGELIEGGKSARDMAPVGERLLAVAASDADLLNAFAWAIMDDPRIKDRDLALALKAVKQANDLTAGRKHEILDTYARALFENHRVQEAIEQQRKAVELCADPRLKAEFQRRLEKYEKAASDA